MAGIINIWYTNYLKCNLNTPRQRLVSILRYTATVCRPQTLFCTLFLFSFFIWLRIIYYFNTNKAQPQFCLSHAAQCQCYANIFICLPIVGFAFIAYICTTIEPSIPLFMQNLMEIKLQQMVSARLLRMNAFSTNKFSFSMDATDENIKHFSK